MRFVVDNQLPPRLSKFLEEAGHDSVHVAMVGMDTADDRALWDWARREALVEAFSQSLPAVVAALGEGQRVSRSVDRGGKVGGCPFPTDQRGDLSPEGNRKPTRLFETRFARPTSRGARETGAHPHLSSARVTSGNAAILPEILRRIVDAYRPAQVYLFGSEARGDAGSDSDIDLAVIVRDDAPEHQSTPRMAAEALWGLERGADVVVFRESEFAARRGVVSSLPWTIRREGKLLYGG